MEIDRNELAQNYRNKPTEQLLELYASGTLTEVAYDVLKEELAHRGNPIPERSKVPAVFKNKPQSLTAHWKGEASLASAYWLIGVLGGMVFSLLSIMLASSSAILLVFIAWIPYSIFALVSIWRCAWNSSWRGWGYLARSVVVVNILYFANLFLDFA